MIAAGYQASPWPAEDGGPNRLQRAARSPALGLRPGERLSCVTRRTCLSTMTLLGDPGEVFLMTHSALRSNLGLPTSARIERIDPLSLAPIARSPALAGGPMWPGGMALHRNRRLYVVYGRYAHRLERDCRPSARYRLPINEPYNSFVVLDNGLLVTKNLSGSTRARLTVLDPDSLTPAAADQVCDEASIARLSSVGDTLYMVGVRSIFRWHWDRAAGRLRLDDDWRFDYVGQSSQTHGWDVVLDGSDAWFMDNGLHRYRHRMDRAGVGPGANRLIRVSLADARDHQSLPISGLPRGSITNPPLVDIGRGIAVAYDSANRYLCAWRIDRAASAMHRLWEKSDFGCASHMILYPDSGELVVNDYRRLGEEVVVLNIENGDELGRARVGGLFQGVVFPSPGWSRDLYWSSMGRVSRVFVS